MVQLIDLDAAMSHAGTIVVDNLVELDRLAARAKGEILPNLWLRIRPGLAVETHAFRQTGQADSKFGMDPGEARQAVQVCQEQGLSLNGVHFHQGSHFHDPAPIGPALDTILEKGGKGRLVEVLQDIREEIKGGTALSDAFEKYSGVFSQLYVASIRAGERTGDLPQTIRRYLTFLKRVEGFRKKIISAFIYPAILVTVAFFAVSLLLLYVVPTFTKVYADAGSQLPAGRHAGHSPAKALLPG